jgi:predicted cobalt transporter CbtA
MVGQLLLRGMLAGLIAGILAFAFAYGFGEPEIEYAIGLEEQKAIAAGEDPGAVQGAEPDIVSRSVQSGIGLATGILGFGAAVGGIFALVFAFAYGRTGNLGARATSALLAIAAYLAVVIVPQIKYAPNPPAVGSAETIAARTSLFFILLLFSVAVMAGAIMLAQRLWVQRGPWAAGITAGLVWLVTVVVIQLALPSVNEVPADFSADSLWRFRMVSLGTHAIIWLVIGLVFGGLAERFLEKSARSAPLPRAPA